MINLCKLIILKKIVVLVYIIKEISVHENLKVSDL